jgi:circadian clock protein KaiC
MDEPREPGSIPPRVPTGIAGLDEILRGGIFQSGIYIVRGVPGVGKTILGNQMAFNHVRAGGRAVYATLLSESHGRLLAFLQKMAFFDGRAVGTSLHYLNGYSAIETEGLPGFLKLVRGIVRERSASLLIIDGMMTAASLVESELEYKKFVQELQSWIEVIGCTVVILTSAREAELRPEYTMVDGILELEYPEFGSRRVRELTVTKLRGTAFCEGRHTYDITDRGIEVFPRVECRFGQRAQTELPDGRVGFGDATLDAMMSGGVARGSATLLIGSSGSGKTILGQQFLGAGLAAGERCFHLGFYEDCAVTLASGDRLGFSFSEHAERGRLECRWLPMAEGIIDRIGDYLISGVERSRAQRVVVDGLQALANVSRPERLAGAWGSLAQELRARGVTMVIGAETRQLFVKELEVPIPGMSAAVDNIIYLGQVEREGRIVRLLSVLKTRDRAHATNLVEYDVTKQGVRVSKGKAALSTARAPRSSSASPRGGRGRGR